MIEDIVGKLRFNVASKHFYSILWGRLFPDTSGDLQTYLCRHFGSGLVQCLVQFCNIEATWHHGDCGWSGRCSGRWSGWSGRWSGWSAGWNGSCRVHWQKQEGEEDCAAELEAEARCRDALWSTWSTWSCNTWSTWSCRDVLCCRDRRVGPLEAKLPWTQCSSTSARAQRLPLLQARMKIVCRTL